MPVRNLDSSLARNAQVLPTSSGEQPRPSGTVAMKTFSFSGFPRNKSDLYINESQHTAKWYRRTNTKRSQLTIQFPYQQQDKHC